MTDALQSLGNNHQLGKAAGWDGTPEEYCKVNV